MIIALIAEDERMLKSMSMELNDRCKDYGMKININKTNTMVIIRKPKKIVIQIKDEFVEHVDSFKYFGCNTSSNLNCCQEEKKRIAMAKEAFNRKRIIFCGPLEKELRKRKRTKEEASEVLCVEFSVVWCSDLDTMTESTAVEQLVACELVTQRARVRSPVGTNFLGEVFLGFFLTCKTSVRKL